MNHIRNPRRRELLLGAAGVAAAGVSGLGRAQDKSAPGVPDYATWKDVDEMIVHSTRTMETRRSAFGTSVITPDDILFIRNNLPPPPNATQNADAWEVAFEGVRRPRTLRLQDLRKLGVEALPMVLQCSGNGRGFFGHKASGSQWLVGASGCVIFSGVPLEAVVEALGGVDGEARYLTGTGGEVLPPGLPPASVRVERSVPADAMKHALLAWEMNGEPLSLAHGGPLRLVVPGYFGVNNVKYVKRIGFTREQSEAAIQQTGYRIRPIGTKGAPDQPSMWRMSVKSWIHHPLAEDGPLREGEVLLYGVAFGGDNRVRNVEVTFDGGRTWQPTRFFGPDLGPYAWRQFVHQATLGRGTHTVASRATDSRGATQPELRVENERGYGHTGWRDHAVTFTVT
jgi:DMSO/TMAO reductase YedYZ molybdopterin-dependent catalytic subunit